MNGHPVSVLPEFGQTLLRRTGRQLASPPRRSSFCGAPPHPGFESGRLTATLSGFGNFVLRDKHERRGRDPHTGKALMISARRVLVFKESPLFKGLLNPKRALAPEAVAAEDSSRAAGAR